MPNCIINLFKNNTPLVPCLLFAGLLLVVCFPADAQEQDTTAAAAVVQKHSVQKAILMSMVFPGLGQIYNKKYWKLPIIYGAGGAFAYFVGFNQLKYNKFRDAYKNGKPGEIYRIEGYPFHYEDLPRGRDYYRRYRDLSVLGLGAIYFLNIIDAMVDASFFYFDVTDNLSMKLEPEIITGQGITASVGLRIKLGF